MSSHFVKSTFGADDSDNDNIAFGLKPGVSEPAEGDMLLGLGPGVPEPAEVSRCRGSDRVGYHFNGEDVQKTHVKMA